MSSTQSSNHVLSFLMIILLASSGESSASDQDHLLGISVVDSRPEETNEFNTTVDAAFKAGLEWPMDPLLVAIRFTSFSGERRSEWSINGQGERPTHYEIIAVADGFLDDSVRGTRYEFTVAQKHNGVWHVNAARSSWRCWPGRGHEIFSANPCS